jgi:hypothetical protein
MTEKMYELADAWRLAIRREQDAHDFYTKMARSAEDAAAKAFFEALAEEELRHKSRLEHEFTRVFQPDLEEPRGRTGTFIHELHKGEQAQGFSWWEWDDEAFRLARELDVPIVLDISASWCHWCHVMDEKTYADPQVAEIINSDFIPIRVDTDKRPDVNHRYNMGGWPTTAFLTPDGDVLTGGTYLTVPQFLEIARKVSDYYRENKGKIQEKAEELRSEAGAVTSIPVSTDELSAKVVEDAVSVILMGFDKENGGFGSEPKFPQTDSLELALAEYQRSGAEQLRNVVEKTLRNMASGGMYDQVEGGFFRYSTTRDWSIPHFEKMAEDNARLLALYVRAYQVFGDEFYKNTAASVLRYMLQNLTDERGFFYSSQDADEEYYTLPAAERARRKAPYIDKTPYTNYNAMLVSALLHAGVALDDRAPTDAALKAVDVIWDRHYEPGRGMAHTKGPDGEVWGLLSDQVSMAQALVDAHEFTTEPRYLQRAAELMEFVYAHLHDAASGGFYDKVDDPKAFGKLRERDKSLTENALAAEVALRLHAFTGDDHHREAAGKALAWFGEMYKAYGYFASGYAMSVRAYLHEPIQAIIVGSADDERTRDLRQASLRLYAPYRVIQVVDPQWEKDRLVRLGYPAEPAPRAYICVGLTCAQPTDKAQEIAGIVAPLVSPWKGRTPR